MSAAVDTHPDDGTAAAIDFAAGAWSRGGHLEPPPDVAGSAERNLWRLTEGATREAVSILDPAAPDREPGSPRVTSEALVVIVARALVVGEQQFGYSIADARAALELAQSIVAEAVRRLERDSVHREANGHDKSASATGGAFPLFTARQVLSMPKMSFRIEGLSLPMRGRGTLAGPSGHGKGLIIEDLAISVARGTRFRRQYDVAQCAVLIVVAEGWAGIPGRERAAYDLHSIEPDEDLPLFYVAAAPTIDNPGVAEELAAFVRIIQPRPRLTFIDTYRATFRGDENDSGEVANYLRGLDLLVEATDGFVCTAAHTPWTGDRERGSTAFRAAMDWVGLVTKEDDVVTLSCLKSKDGPEFLPLRWRIEPRADSAVVVPVGDEPERETPRRWGDLPCAAQKFLRALADHFDAEGATASQLQRTSGVPESSFFRTSKTVREWGFVDKDRQRLRLTERGRGVLS